ncbi:MAG: hypothetical protein Tsb0020_39050 [Haliangiales bacterium]
MTSYLPISFATRAARRFPSRSTLLLSLLLGVAAAGCDSNDPPGGVDAGAPGADAGPAVDADPGTPAVDAGPALPQLRSCHDQTLPADLPVLDEWSNPLNDVVTLGDPWHSAQDVLVATDGDAQLAGKFSYGDVSKDLEGERVEVWIDDCGDGYRRLGEAVTDSDGRMAVSIAASDLPAIGSYQLQFRVMGDGTTASAALRVYPPGTRFIVFDIDATLTTSDSELVDQLIFDILDGDVPIPTARAEAHELVTLRFAEHGYELIYLTGRPYLLDAITRAWLDDLGFPAGTVHLTDDVAQSWPSDSAVGDYKAEFLIDVIAQGFAIDAAYGNASSDIYAYEQAAIAKQRTYILGENGGTLDTVALGEGYVAHRAEVSGEAPAAQPFVR